MSRANNFMKLEKIVKLFYDLYFNKYKENYKENAEICKITYIIKDCLVVGPFDVPTH